MIVKKKKKPCKLPKTTLGCFFNAWSQRKCSSYLAPSASVCPGSPVPLLHLKPQPVTNFVVWLFLLWGKHQLWGHKDSTNYM